MYELTISPFGLQPLTFVSTINGGNYVGWNCQKKKFGKVICPVQWQHSQRGLQLSRHSTLHVPLNKTILIVIE